MLEATDLECVRGERRLFVGVGFRLNEGEMLSVQGKNGSGKTSLLRMMCGLSPVARGEIRWRGALIGALGEDYRRDLCYLGHHNAIKEELTPLENLLASARSARTSRPRRSRGPGLPLPVARTEAPRCAGPSGQ